MQNSWIQRGFICFLLLIIPLLTWKHFNVLKGKRRFLSALEQEELAFPRMRREKPFVVVVFAKGSSITNRTLQSIAEQKYDNYRVVYIDPDRKKEEILSTTPLLRDKMQEKGWHVFGKEHNKSGLDLYKKALYGCRDEEIAVHLEGRDWFAHQNVLHSLNTIHQNEDIWLTYGECLYYPLELGENPPEEILAYKNKRDTSWERANLKTYYVGLFKQVSFGVPSLKSPKRGSIQRSRDGGDGESPMSSTSKEEFINATMMPMLHLSKRHVLFIPEILYVHHL